MSMTYFFRFIVPAILAMIAYGKVLAVELPLSSALSAKYKIPDQKVTVVEPHESTGEHLTLVEYTALSVNALLTQWYGDRWQNADAEIVFLAKDGYRSVVAGSKLKKYDAFLAFARSDGAPFVVDNRSQNEQRIPLGPYYLIWDNLNEPELLRQGAYGWPYQVAAIELHSKSENQGLRPRRSYKMMEQGLEETREYCLTCHSIHGIGGKKYPVDLIQAACGWQEADLKTWIDSPDRLRPGTSMPSLASTLPAKERQQLIDRIVSYLRVMQAESSEPCITKYPG